MYAFSPTLSLLLFLKLYRCLGHGLKMCILLGHIPKIIFVTFSQKELE